MDYISLIKSTLHKTKLTNNLDNDIITISSSLSKKLRIKELLKYKEVLYFLSWKDVIVRYKQTVLGIAWAIIQPIVSMIILTFIFGNVAKIDSKGIPYPVVVFTALIPWNFFSNGMNAVSNSLVGNSHLITKIYFPRLTLPISSLITAFIDSIISLGILAFLILGYRYVPPIRLVMLPFFYALVFAISLGSGMFFSVLNVRYRDIRYLVPFILQFGMYVSPVGYSSNIVPEQFRLLYSLNPIVGAIDGFRWCIIPTARIYFPSLFASVAFAIAALFFGIKFFNKFEDSFADYI